MYQEIQVETDIGNLTVVFTGGDHAHVRTSSGGYVSVRGKEYTASCHFHLVNGNWQVKGALTVTKRKYVSYSQSNAAPTIAAKVVEYCREALVSAVADDPTLPARAEVDSLTRSIARLTAERSDLLKQAGEKFIEIRQLYARRNKVVGA